jgi:hypothetical protein
MKSLWKRLDSGLIEAVVIDCEWELYTQKPAEFWRRVTMELPVACYTVITRIQNPAPELFTLRLTGSPGPPEMVWG